MSTVKRILEMARADCELNWWHSDGTNLMPPKGKVCAGTALQIAGGVLNVSEEIIQNAYDSFRRQLPGGVHASIPIWNDEPGRTLAEVLAMYDQAIESIS